MKNFLARFAQDESGATAIEYGLIAAYHRRWHYHWPRPAPHRPEHPVRNINTKLTTPYA